MCKDMCVGMRIDMCVDMCIDICMNLLARDSPVDGADVDAVVTALLCLRICFAPPSRLRICFAPPSRRIYIVNTAARLIDTAARLIDTAARLIDTAAVLVDTAAHMPETVRHIYWLTAVVAESCHSHGGGSLTTCIYMAEQYSDRMSRSRVSPL